MSDILSIFHPLPLREAEFPEERVVQLQVGKEYLHQSEVFNKSEQNSAIYNFYQVYSEFLAMTNVLIDWP